LMPMLLMFS